MFLESSDSITAASNQIVTILQFKEINIVSFILFRNFKRLQEFKYIYAKILYSLQILVFGFSIDKNLPKHLLNAKLLRAQG